MSADSSAGKILIVDDVPVNLRLLSDLLRSQGYTVRLVVSGERALKSVELDIPDLVLLDVKLPDMSGFDVCAQLKANPMTRHIPVIFVTALSDMSDKLQAFAVGAVDYMTKPFQAEEVLARVRNQLLIQRSQRDLQQLNTQLQGMNERLSQMVSDLEQRTYEMLLINRLSTLLQQASSIPELCSLAVPLLIELFPRQSGALYSLDSDTLELSLLVSWGEDPPAEQRFLADNCWAFAGTRAHLVADPAEELVCAHLPGPEVLPTLCVQIIVRDAPIGLFHLRHGSAQRASDRQWERIAIMAADLIGLSLHNLQLQEALQRQAIHDALTGLFNRRYLDETLEREIHRAARDEDAVGIMLFDLDHFKFYNDTYGHAGGDALLQALAAFLKSHIRRGDIVCRLGGDEFALVLPGATLEQTYERATELQAQIKTISVVYQRQTIIGVTVSIGVAVFPIHGNKPAALMIAADNALYQAKRGGRDRVAIAQPIDNDSPPS